MAWRFFQGHDTQHVGAHTRKPAQADAWYAAPDDYDGDVLSSDPFVTRAEAEAWAAMKAEQEAEEHAEP